MPFLAFTRPARLTLCSIVLGIAGLSAASTAIAITAPDLRSRIVIDGHTGDFASDESVFGNNGGATSYEPDSDSQWGANEELHGIRITWDRRNLYLAVEGTCWANNVILLIDAVPNQGLSGMAGLNSWQRNISFTADFAPDLFLATWDGNLSPRLLLQITGSSVDDQMPGVLFESSATFEQNSAGRAMEARIPWTTLFHYSSHGSAIVRDTMIAGQPDTLVYLPPFICLRLAAALTGGGDGSSGPDVAPDNTTGCPGGSSGALLVMDNYAIVDVDSDHDGLPDMGASPIFRTTFKDTALPVQRSSWGALKVRFR